MDDDLNVAKAWGAIFDQVRDWNRQIAANDLTPDSAAAALAAWDRINTVFAVTTQAESSAPPEIVALLEQRQEARRNRDFARADQLRDELKAQGWVIEDTPKGPRLKPA
jgi:cysteinyl-tRNA synthetase